MKKLKIFFGSSVTGPLKAIRNELARFVLGLNNRLVESGNYVELELCEELPQQMALLRKQEEYNNYIRDADVMYCVFLSDVGQYIKEEFQVAYEAFKEKGNPIVFTYFYADNVESMEENVREFANLLDTKYGHYYCLCTDIATLKLSLLYQISSFFYIEKLELNKGFLCYLNKDWIEVKDIDYFKRNSEYRTVLKQLEAVQEECKSLLGCCGDKQEIHVCLEKIEQLQNRKKLIEEHNFKLIIQMYEDIIKGSMSQLKKNVYRLIEQGKIKEADDLLSEDCLKSFFRQYEELEQTEENIKGECVDLYKQKIQILFMLGMNQERVAEIQKYYSKIYQLAENDSRYVKELIPMVHFLELCDGSAELIEELIEVITWNYSRPKMKIDTIELYQFYYEAFQYYDNNQNRDKKTELFIKMSEKSKSIEGENPAVKCYVYQKLIECGFSMYRVDEASKWINLPEQILKCAEFIADEQQKGHFLGLGYMYLSCNYCMDTRYEEAETAYEKCLECYSTLYEKNPKNWIEEYANTVTRLAHCFYNRGLDFLDELNNNIMAYTKDDEIIDLSQKWCEFEESARSKFFKVYELTDGYLKKHQESQNWKLACKSLLAKAKGLDESKKDEWKEIHESYWAYVEKLLELYEKVPYEVTHEILKGFRLPISFWTHYHVWGDAAYALEKLFGIAEKCYNCNPQKYREDWYWVKKLWNEFEDEKSWEM